MASPNAAYLSDVGEQMETLEGTTFLTVQIIWTEIAKRLKHLCVGI